MESQSSPPTAEDFFHTWELAYVISNNRTVNRKIFFRIDVGCQSLSRMNRRRIDIFIIFHDDSRLRSQKAWALSILFTDIHILYVIVTSPSEQTTLEAGTLYFQYEFLEIAFHSAMVPLNVTLVRLPQL